MDRTFIEEHLHYTLEATDFSKLGQKKAGKVRDVYAQTERMIFITTDRYSAFDRNLALIPFKGELLNRITRFWFHQTRDLIQNHVLEYPDPRVIVGKRCTVLPVEVIVRGYITGITNTALWTRYEAGERQFGTHTLSDGIRKNTKLPEPIITPTTKFEVHDRSLTDEDIINGNMIEEELWNKVKSQALLLFTRGQEVAHDRGLILVDTKYEFGLSPQGELILIDEIHTPDSSRYWQERTYHERMEQGLEPEYFDKEFLRLWFKEHTNPYQDAEMPQAPTDMVVEMALRYVQIYEQITGEIFMPDINTPIMERLEKNLLHYHVT